MPRKQVGMLDAELLARVDARALELGQTRRVFVERALLAALPRGDVEQALGGGSHDRSPAPAEQPPSPVAGQSRIPNERAIVGTAAGVRHGYVGPKRSFSPVPKGGKS